MFFFILFYISASQETVLYNNDQTEIISASGYKEFTVISSVKVIQGIGPNDYCFKGSKNTLTAVIFTEDSALETIQSHAFYSCSLLSSINLEKCTNLKSIGKYSFGYCTSLKNIQFPSLSTLDEYCFGYSGLVSVEIVNSITTLNQYAFGYCRNLNHVTFQQSPKLEAFPGSLFAMCDSLVEITIPASISYSGSMFENCYSLQNVYIEGSPKTYNSYSGILYSHPDNTTLLYFPAGRTGSFRVPDQVTKVGNCAFMGSKLETITFPETLEIIDSWCFVNSWIGNFILPSSLERIESTAFQSCLNLTSIVLPDSLEYIGPNCFKYCKNLIYIRMPTSISPTNIKGGIFSNCSPNLYINISDEAEYSISNFCIIDKQNTTIIQYIGESSTFTILDSVQTISESAFLANNYIIEISIPENSRLKTIKNDAFRECKKLQTINLPDTLETVHTKAFQFCSELRSVYFGSKIQYIYNNAFDGCSALETITFASTSNSLNISDYAFNDCSRASLNHLPSCIQSLGNYAFYNCRNITGQLTIPESVKSIGHYCFYNCGIEECIFSNSLQEIPPFLFSQCSYLTNITFPDGVEVIGSNAFSGTALSSIDLPSSVTTLSQFCFSNCAKLVEFHIPSESLLNDIQYGILSKCFQFSNIKCDSDKFKIENCALYDANQTRFYLLPCNASIKYFSFPVTMKTIGQGAMMDCQNLISIFIPDNSVETIENYAFENCLNLESINIPICVTKIGDRVFDNCPKLRCGLFIENTSESFSKSLIEKSKLPEICLKSCNFHCTQKQINYIPRTYYSLFLLLLNK